MFKENAVAECNAIQTQYVYNCHSHGMKLTLCGSSQRHKTCSKRTKAIGQLLAMSDTAGFDKINACSRPFHFMLGDSFVCIV